MESTVDRAEANRLYWETDESVADIARRLDVSRRTLYVLVEPLPTGEACPQCGGPLAYENRSARQAGLATCEACAAAEAAEDDGDVEVAAPAAALHGDDDRAARLGTAVLIGAAAGALITFALVRRH